MGLLLGLVAVAHFSVRVHAISKDFAAFIVAVAAAYLAYCFQKRQDFLVSLREVWHACIEAKADLIDYIDLPDPGQTDFRRAARSISVAIDMMRAVYRNVGETEHKIGLYPFEPMHDMRLALDGLGFTNLSPKKREEARQRIDNAWDTLRWSFLKEFSAPPPTHSVTKPRSIDPRRGRATSDDPASIGKWIRRHYVLRGPRR
jgi:hypothetical protein